MVITQHFIKYDWMLYSSQMQHKYFIGIELPKELETSIDLLRQEYYPYGYKNVPAHITLAGPFYLPEKKNIPSKEIKQIANLYNSFNISVERFGSFQHTFFVFYVGVELSPTLAQLHMQLSMMLHAMYGYKHSMIEKNQKYKYTPHITIANRLNIEQLQGVRRNTMNLDFRQEFSIDHITLFRKQDGLPYQIAERYTLDKAADLRYHPEADLGNGRHTASATAS